jgi:hypothetical protein
MKRQEVHSADSFLTELACLHAVGSPSAETTPTVASGTRQLFVAPARGYSACSRVLCCAEGPNDAPGMGNPRTAVAFYTARVGFTVFKHYTSFDSGIIFLSYCQ